VGGAENAEAKHGVRLSRDAAVGDDTILGNDHDSLADEIAVSILLFDPGLVDDVDAAARCAHSCRCGALDDRVRADADRRNALGLAGAHLVQGFIAIGADEQDVADAAFLPMRLRMPMTARSMSAPCRRQPSEMRALWTCSALASEAGRKRGLV